MANVHANIAKKDNNQKLEQELGGDTERIAVEFAAPGQHRRAV